MPDIDFVLTYLDANDTAWQQEKNKYTPGATADVNPNRYREWDNLRYFFRSIDKFAPWVRKIHVVTWGHVPAWLDVNHPKIHIVNHKDYLPEEWLPTFSSRCIDMNLHRIPDLAEQFVYFNDDMFLTGAVEPEYFFKNGLPCDAAVLSAQAFNLNSSVRMFFAPYVDTGVINKYFKKRDVIRKNPGKWFNIRYRNELFRTFTMLPYPHFICFRNFHLPYGYLKSTYEEVWEKEPAFLAAASAHKFRDITDPNHFLFTYWQYATGRFTPRDVKYGKYYSIHNIEEAKRAAKDVESGRYKMMCLNDTIFNNDEFEQIKETVNQALSRLLPEKSSFEK